MPGLSPVEALSRIPQALLAVAPTPLQEAPRLAAAIGLKRLLIKRDDNTGLALGGNKARKLEFLVADALLKGADTLVTTGGPQSNHCRMTAAAAARYGLDCRLVFDSSPISEVQGNMILDRLLGATWEFPEPDESSDRCMERIAQQLRADGRVPYVVPLGASNARGVLGYVKAAFELAGQFAVLETPPRSVYCATGSCGTAAGLALGFGLSDVSAEVVAVAVSSTIPDKARVIQHLAEEAAALLGLQTPTLNLRVLDTYIGDGYGQPTRLSTQALALAATTEGIILDPVYTAKGFSGLMGDVAAGAVNRTSRVVFVHTGGSPALFAYDSRHLYWPKQHP